MKTKQIETERLLLCRPNTEYLAHIEAWLSDPEMMTFVGGPMEKDKIGKFIEFIDQHWERYCFGHYLIFEKNDHSKPIGMISLKYMNEEDAENKIPDIGIMLSADSQRKGYAVESGKALVNYAKRELNLTEIQAHCHPENESARKILNKSGFNFVGEKESEAYGINFGNSSHWRLNISQYESDE